jgi:hypothetical protein
MTDAWLPTFTFALLAVGVSMLGLALGQLLGRPLRGTGCGSDCAPCPHAADGASCALRAEDP